MQSAPDGFQLQHAFQRGIAGIIGAVQGADTGADHHVRGDAVAGERMHHADLNGAKTASSGEDKGRPGQVCIVRYETKPRSLPVSIAPRSIGRVYSSPRRFYQQSGAGAAWHQSTFRLCVLAGLSA